MLCLFPKSPCYLGGNFFSIHFVTTKPYWLVCSQVLLVYLLLDCLDLRGSAFGVWQPLSRWLSVTSLLEETATFFPLLHRFHPFFNAWTDGVRQQPPVAAAVTNNKDTSYNKKSTLSCFIGALWWDNFRNCTTWRLSISSNSYHSRRLREAQKQRIEPKCTSSRFSFKCKSGRLDESGRARKPSCPPFHSPVAGQTLRPTTA